MGGRSGWLLAGLALVVGVESGCLQTETSQTWYLQPDAAVTWQVTEQYVRSTAGSEADRQQEELAYMNGVRSGTHPVALGLARLGATMPETRIVRASPPYAVITQGRFSDIGLLGRQLIAVTGTGGSSILERSADGLTWTMTLVDDEPGAGDAHGDSGDVMAALLTGFEHLRVVLVAGHFTSAQGFDLSGDRRVASLTAFGDEQLAADTTHVLSLSWSGR